MANGTKLMLMLTYPITAITAIIIGDKVPGIFLAGPGTMFPNKKLSLELFPKAQNLFASGKTITFFWLFIWFLR